MKAGELVKGQEYKVKFDWVGRAATKTYTGDQHIGDYDTEKYPHGVAKFEGRGGIVFAPYNQIESATEAKPRKVKVKTKTCNRCSGTGILPHVSHVLGGMCFKCGGDGKL